MRIYCYEKKIELFSLDYDFKNCIGSILFIYDCYIDIRKLDTESVNSVYSITK